MHGTVVCAVTDGMENDDAVDQAAEISERLGLRLVLAHVVDGGEVPGNGGAEEAGARGERTAAERRLEDLAAPHVTDDPAALPAIDVALVLGAAPIGPEGGPNRYFEYRLDAAAALWRAGKVKYFLVSGDHRPPDYDEPTAMRAGLIERGVPAGVIYRDFAGVRDEKPRDGAERTVL